MLKTLIGSAQQLSSEDIEDFEKSIGGEFSQEFKNFYLNINGGYIDDSKGGNSLLLAGFVPIKYGKVPMEQAYKELTEDFPALKGKVPFAFDEGGNYFLLSNAGLGQKEEISLWIMDTEECQLVAESFSEFLDRLSV